MFLLEEKPNMNLPSRIAFLLLCLFLLLLGAGITLLTQAAGAWLRDTAQEATHSAVSPFLPQEGPEDGSVPPAQETLREEMILEESPHYVPGEKDWQLVLVNAWQHWEGAEPTLTTLRNGMQVDERCYPDLQAMMDACRAHGLQPVICSSYRSVNYQELLFRDKVDRLLGEGYPPDRVEEEAARHVARPGTSEHHTGLAIDVVDLSMQLLEQAQEDTSVTRWMHEHSWEYGFVLRYPEGTSDLTGVIYEPWHYRYVGREHARAMHEAGLCLEAYVESLEEAS